VVFFAVVFFAVVFFPDFLAVVFRAANAPSPLERAVITAVRSQLLQLLTSGKHHLKTHRCPYSPDQITKSL
jgi:hypothetical protein